MYRSIDMVLDVEITLAVAVLDDIDEAKSRPGVAKNVNLLKDVLRKTQAFLKDANSNKLLEDERVISAWMSEVRGLVHDAEDAEIFLVNAEINDQGSSRRSGIFKSITTKRDQTGEVIDSIARRLCAIHQKHNFWNLSLIRNRKTEIPLEIGRSWAALAYREKDDQVVGIEDEVKRVLRESILDEEKKGVSIAVVEGKLGIGKTTLARQIYHHPDVVARFECRAWVSVSTHQFSLETTMKQLILQLPASDTLKIWELESKESTKGKPYVQQKFQEMLLKQLQGKTYFIVFDNVLEMEHWKSLKPAFPDEQDKTSRLLVTTRNKYIATLERHTHYRMKLLDQEKSWKLFLMKACIGEMYDYGGRSKQLLGELIGREIVKACNGLPLTISLVGGLLVGTRSWRGWKQVLDLMISEGDENRILKIISELSYQNLSPRLQACFLCLAFFKGDTTIPAKTFLNIWVAQGFIHKDDSAREEAIARDYLQELTQRNMLQIVDMSMEDEVKNLYLYGFLRDEVCLRRANEELRLEMTTTVVKRAEPRHRVVYGGDLKTLSSNPGTHLRSLFLHNHEGAGNVDVSSVSHDFWKSCQLLKTLHLDGIKLSAFPDSLRALVRLKYLMIRRHKIHPKSLEAAVKLPNWLDDLKHLEIVDMKGEKVEFPNDDVALKMKRLRYFSAYCVRGPMSINSWENIETLKYMRQEDWMQCYSTLMSSSCNCKVRKLGLFLDPVNRGGEWREVRDSLAKMEKLQHLQLQWNSIISIDPEIVPKLPTLTKLKLRGKLTKSPDATIFHPHLSHLTLAFSDLTEDLMPKLSKLPQLSYLKLLGNAYKPEIIQVLSDSFLRLRILTLKEMLHLKSIDIETGGMRSLQKLRIQHCPSLQIMNLPEHVVINRIS